LVDLIRLDTSNPPGEEKRVVDYTADFCRARDIQCQIFDEPNRRCSLIAEVGGHHDGRRLFFPAHADVVPAGDNWSVPPFAGVVKDGWVWGRGATDNKGALAGLLAVLEYLKPREKELPGAIVVGVLADEERGSTLGLERLLRENRIRADAAMVPDVPSRLSVIELAEKGYLDVRVVFLGKQAHSSNPALGANALAAAAEFILMTEKNELSGGRNKHPFLSPTTLVPSILNAGSAPNIVPGRAELTLNVRFLPGQTEESILADIRKWTEATCAKRDGIKVEASVAGRSLPPTEVPAKSDLTAALRDALTEVTGDQPNLIGIGGATLCKQLIAYGIPAVGYGLGDGEMPHMADERLEIEQLPLFISATLAAARNYLYAQSNRPN
jgi:acetylornithine deacetylase/succinyl-diaminopimelate desuccinylase family protein